jgi:hypothetical protein
MLYRVLFGAGLALTLAGCGNSAGPRTTSVSGVVKIDGQPMANVEVHFLSDQHAGYGKTDEEGRYHLLSGAAPGSNKVYFSKIVDPMYNEDPEAGMDAGQFEAAASATAAPGAAAPAVSGQLIPPEYASAETTKLTFLVPEGGTESANFELESQQ